MIRVAARPTGIAQAEHFRLDSAPLAPLADGQIRVRNAWLSVEPAMRGWLADTSNYSTPIAIGDVMRALCAGTVTESLAPGWRVGDTVMGWFGWQEVATVTPDRVVHTITRADLPMSAYLGVLGLNGVTAAAALERIGRPKAGDTVVVSTAAGGVGSCVGQLAKLQGCRTVGLTSSPEKVAACRERFGFDHVINYRTDDIGAALKAACPDGVNVYFDNTSGAISDAVMPHLAIGARVVVCGTASIAQWDPVPLGPRVERILLTRRASMQGFLLFDHKDAYEHYVNTLSEHVQAGRLRYQEDITEGLESALDAIAGLYRSENTGKRLIRL
jgi:NADPH-dependent curcumin reductase CurA